MRPSAPDSSPLPSRVLWLSDLCSAGSWHISLGKLANGLISSLAPSLPSLPSSSCDPGPSLYCPWSGLAAMVRAATICEGPAHACRPAPGARAAHALVSAMSQHSTYPVRVHDAHVRARARTAGKLVLRR